MIAPRMIRRAVITLLAPALTLVLALPAQAEIAFREITSPGGIKAWMVEDYTVPIITIAFAFDGGTAQDPVDKLGRTALMTSLFDEGAGEFDSDAFQIRQDEVGLEMGFSASPDNVTGFARMLVDDREGATELLTLAVADPRFDQPAIDRMRDQLTARLVASSRSPGYAANRMWNEALFGEHPYARPSDGTEATLAAVTDVDLDALHRSVFARDTLTVGIVGALDEATAGAMIDQIFGALPQAPELVSIPEAELSFGQKIAVDYPLPQTFINLAYPGIPEDDEDFFEAYVMTELLAGGSLLSELNVEVRERRGLSYGVSGGLVNLEHADALTIGTSTSPENAAEALEVIRATLARMAEDGPNPAELERIKRYLIGAYPINQLRSSVSIAGAMVGQQLRDLPPDYVEGRSRLIEAVTAEDVQAMAKRIFSAEPSILQLGPGADDAEASN